MAKKKKIRRNYANDAKRWEARYEERVARHEDDIRTKDQQIKRLENKLAETDRFLLCVLKDFYEEITAGR